MVYCVKGLTPEKLVSDMGKFETETNPLKRQARKGQLFSTSQFITENFTIEKIEDIKRVAIVKDEST